MISALSTGISLFSRRETMYRVRIPTKMSHIGNDYYFGIAKHALDEGGVLLVAVAVNKGVYEIVSSYVLDLTNIYAVPKHNITLVMKDDHEDDSRHSDERVDRVP